MLLERGTTLATLIKVMPVEFEEELDELPDDVKIKHLKERPAKPKLKIKVPERDLKLRRPEREINLTTR